MSNLNQQLLQKQEEQKFDTSVFSKIRKQFFVGQKITVEDGEIKQETPAEVTYVGQRFCTVRLPKGHSISINYASMIDKNNKDVYATTVKI